MEITTDDYRSRNNPNAESGPNGTHFSVIASAVKQSLKDCRGPRASLPFRLPGAGL